MKLPPISETFRASAAELHAKARTIGGLHTVVEGIIDIFPGMDTEKPETLPLPVRAFLRVVRSRASFAVVLVAPHPDTGKMTAWAAEVTS